VAAEWRAGPTSGTATSEREARSARRRRGARRRGTAGLARGAERGRADATCRRRRRGDERSRSRPARADDGGGGRRERGEGHGGRQAETQDDPRVIDRGDPGQGLGTAAPEVVPAFQDAREVRRRDRVRAQEATQAADGIRRSHRCSIVERRRGQRSVHSRPSAALAHDWTRAGRGRPSSSTSTRTSCTRAARMRSVRPRGTEGASVVADSASAMRSSPPVARAKGGVGAASATYGQGKDDGEGGGRLSAWEGPHSWEEPHLRGAISKSAIRNPPAIVFEGGGQEGVGAVTPGGQSAHRALYGDARRRRGGGGVAPEQDAVVVRRGDRGWPRRAFGPQARQRGAGPPCRSGRSPGSATPMRTSAPSGPTAHPSSGSSASRGPSEAGCGQIEEVRTRTEPEAGRDARPGHRVRLMRRREAVAVERVEDRARGAAGEGPARGLALRGQEDAAGEAHAGERAGQFAPRLEPQGQAVAAVEGERIVEEDEQPLVPEEGESHDPPFDRRRGRAVEHVHTFRARARAARYQRKERGGPTAWTPRSRRRARPTALRRHAPTRRAGRRRRRPSRSRPAAVRRSRGRRALRAGHARARRGPGPDPRPSGRRARRARRDGPAATRAISRATASARRPQRRRGAGHRGQHEDRRPRAHGQG
jgi:hypothetical protein